LKSKIDKDQLAPAENMWYIHRKECGEYEIHPSVRYLAEIDMGS